MKIDEEKKIVSIDCYRLPVEIYNDWIINWYRLLSIVIGNDFCLFTSFTDKIISLYDFIESLNLYSMQDLYNFKQNTWIKNRNILFGSSLVHETGRSCGSVQPSSLVVA